MDQPYTVLFIILTLCLIGHSDTAAGFSFSFPSSCSEPTKESCPACCKNLENVAAAGEPVLTAKGVKSVDRCIAICSNHTYYGLSNKQVCGCFDGCSTIEVPPSPFRVTSGLVSACLAGCFRPEAADQSEPAACPQHSVRLPMGRRKDPMCCCKAPFDSPRLVGGVMTCARNEDDVAADAMR